MDAERAKTFIGMYVNDWTVDFGRAGYKAIKTFLDRGYREGILQEPVNLAGCVYDVKRGRVRTGLQSRRGKRPKRLPESGGDAAHGRGNTGVRRFHGKNVIYEAFFAFS
jgi:hypothetical protein